MSLRSWLLDSSFSPVLVHEYRTRLRKMRWFAILSIVFMLLLCFLLNAIRGQQILGLQFLNILSYPATFLSVLITVSQTANAITREREKQTLETLLITPLSERDIILGKYLLACALILLMMLPLLLGSGIAIFLELTYHKPYFGDTIPTIFNFNIPTMFDIISMPVKALITMLFCGALGIYFSTLFKHSGTAINMTLITLFFASMLIPNILRQLSIPLLQLAYSIAGDYTTDINDRLPLFVPTFMILLEIAGTWFFLAKAGQRIRRMREPVL